ncbi:glycosyltransferase family 4 protein [Mesotoga sp. UBA5847]|jgi:glycosyltransferase involved in cell wall biosynthesis|uniref:glycosyltransferase family 4 protein n=1 Tax=Mesotoga sp. UBA5847 TaxID=1946859 RepID=UPI0025DC0961|nr:glycosyltransferase family 4 protein [Mesotoga sp. UBA5847]
MTRYKEEYDVALVVLGFDRMFRDLAEGLAKKGLRVLVVAASRSYKNPKEVFVSERISDKLMIERVEIPELNKNKLLEKLLFFYFFSKRLKGVLREKGIRLFIAPLMPLLIPYKTLQFSKMTKKPFLFILEDLVPDTWIRRERFSEKHPFVRLIKRQTRSLLLDSRKVVVIGRDMREYIEETYKVPEENIVFIPNWANSSEKLETNGEEQKFEVLYGGTIGEAQKLDTLIGAARVLQERKVDINIKIVGDGMEKKNLQEIVKRENLKNVQFCELVPEREFRKLMMQTSVLVVTLREESKGMSVPSKLYTYLTAGKPILAIVPEGSELDMEIKEDQFGISVSGNSPELIADAIIKLKEDKEFRERAGINALKAFETKYNDVIAVDKYYEVIKQLLEEKK